MSGALKNFFDIVKEPAIYQNKRIALLASNHKNQDYGAWHAQETIQGLLIFFGIQAVIVPEILIQHHQALNETELSRFIELIEDYKTILT